MKANPDVRRAKEHRRRARKLAAQGSFTFAEWRALREQYGNKCLACGSSDRLTIDHIVPLAQGGSNFIDNIQPLCLPCNSRKSTKIIDYRNGK